MSLLLAAAEEAFEVASTNSADCFILRWPAGKPEFSWTGDWL